MLTAQRQTNEPSAMSIATPLSLPRWLAQLCDRPDAKTLAVATSDVVGLNISVTQWNQLRLVSVRITDAKKLAPLTLQRRVVDAYTAIRGIFTTDGDWQPIRLWNWIPDIHADMADGMNRYMVFNAGRFSAYFDWYQTNTNFEGLIATATGVGHHGDDLVIYALATDTAGKPVENPRQIQSYCYSNRFGPMPPCFARATLTPNTMEGLPNLLIGGTASVCGEATKHAGMAADQTKETLHNLALVIEEGARLAESERGASSSSSSASSLSSSVLALSSSASVDVASQLKRLESVRVYYQHDSDHPSIFAILQPFLNHLDTVDIEWTRADICRPDLIVEIEGTASIK